MNATQQLRRTYGDEAIDIALARGWSDADQHAMALAMAEDGIDDPAMEDVIALSHPFNHLTEEEVERLTGDDYQREVRESPEALLDQED